MLMEIHQTNTLTFLGDAPKALPHAVPAVKYLKPQGRPWLHREARALEELLTYAGLVSAAKIALSHDQHYCLDLC